MSLNFVHYQASNLNLNEDIKIKNMSDMNRSCPHVSAGHHKHEYTTGTSWP